MADGDGNGGQGSAQTFTEADVERIVRERLAREKNKFADYNDLKAKAAVADQAKSDVDKLTDAVRALTERAEKAERDGIRRDVADRFKLPKIFADKLSGTSKDDLEREARDLVDELKKLGVKFDDDGKSGGKDGGGNAGGKGDGDGSGSSGSGDGKADGGGQGSTGGDGGNAGGGNGGSNGQQDSGQRSILGGRPREDLKSGAAPSGGGQGFDAAKLAGDILARPF